LGTLAWEPPLPELLGFLLLRTPEFQLERLDERIVDNALIEKAVAGKPAAITCPSSRFCVQVDWICKHWPTSLALLLIDLEQFKQINDTFGDDAGNAVLIETAIQPQWAVRESDCTFRLDGNESPMRQ